MQAKMGTGSSKLGASPHYCKWLFVGAGLLLALWSVARADTVILKGGFTLHGKIKRESHMIYEGGAAVSVPNANASFMIDDGARWIKFSQKQVQVEPASDATGVSDVMRLESKITKLDRFRVPSGVYAGFTPWDAKWDRVLKIDSGRGKPVDVVQHLSVLTPTFARIEARRYNWIANYLTTELDPESVRAALYLHPSLKLDGSAGDLAKRYKVYQFLLQAGWFDKASLELDEILKTTPAEKEKVASLRDDLKKLLSAEILKRIEQAQKAGQHQWAQQSLSVFPQADVDQAVLVRMHALQTSYEKTNKNIALARRFLGEWQQQMTDSTTRELLTEASNSLAAELNPDTIERLEAFITLSQQSARDKERNRTPDYTPEKLVSLAVSGWLLGNAAAEAKVDTAVRLWQTRQFVLAYQKCHTPAQRQQLLAGYQAGKAVAFDVMARLIRYLPPPEPSDGELQSRAANALAALRLGQGARYWSVFSALRLVPTNRLTLQADLPWNFRRSAEYQVLLPPEYHPGRSYPVLMVLHEAGEKPETMLKRWGRQAAAQGYILVSPEWKRGLKHLYTYSLEEHAAVIDVLRDMRRRFQIDSDRVFLTGYGEGGNMTYDVGLAHPDLFAGILPMAGQPRYFVRKYWPNGQYLGIYAVDGDLDGEICQDNRRQFEKWLQRGYPALYVEYKGRGMEWFEGELPIVFDWMNRQKRGAAFPQMGKMDEPFQTMRPTDNRFYWVSAEGLSARHANDAGKWNNTMMPAGIQAQISEGQINLHATGFKRATIWLGQGMIDFEKPFTMFVNLKLHFANRKVAPNLETLIEDFYLRGDRERLFYAKVEIAL